MWSKVRDFVTRSRAFAKFLTLVAILAVGLGLWGHQPQVQAQSSLVDRLQMLRSTSPESGITSTDSTAYDVAVADALIGDLQHMSEVCAMAAQSDDPELSSSALAWTEELESGMTDMQAKRSQLVAARLAAIKSVSPESGIN